MLIKLKQLHKIIITKILTLSVLNLKGSDFDTQLKNRVKDMLKKGFIDEVDEIIKIYKSNQLPLLNSAGYKEVSMFLENKIKKDVLIENGIIAKISGKN